MESMEKELIKHALLKGVVKGFFLSGIAALAFNGPIDQILNIFLIGIAIACFLTFYIVYRVNWLLYLKFKEKYGTDYINLVDIEFKELGMKKMLKEDWFAEVARQDHRGEFLRRLEKKYGDSNRIKGYGL